jgi:transcriptional regulator with XRE-family HTH domain
MSKKSLFLPRAIRQARAKRYWTQAELAQRVGVSQGTVSFWERGIESPSLEHRIQLVMLMPEIFEQLAKQETDVLARLYRLERAIYGGKCSCQGCGCSG